MNPVLLKPTSDVGSQVIVNGEVVGSMSAAAYLSYKKQLIPTILESYHALAQTHDIVVLEGAGSPAEINLKAEDIVNMGMARMAGGGLCCWRVTSTGAVSLLPFTGPWPCWSLMSGLW